MTDHQKSLSNFDKFIYDNLYDIANVLRKHRSGVLDDLQYTTDEDERRNILTEVAKIDGWLTPLDKRDACEQALAKIRIVLEDRNISPENAWKRVQRLATSSGARVGRPRNGVGLHAIRALTIKRSTNKPWSEIALELRGCKHRHPPGRSCDRCKEALRNAVSRLQQFLRRTGIDDSSSFATGSDLTPVDNPHE